MCKLLNKYFQVLHFKFHLLTFRHCPFPPASSPSSSSPTCRWTLLISRCMCCTWRSSTSGTCSCTARCGCSCACRAPGRSTSCYNRPCGWRCRCTVVPAFPCFPWPCPPRSSWANAPGTPGPCPWASGSPEPLWVAGRRVVGVARPGPAPPERPRCSAPSAGDPALWTWAGWSSRSWWCRNRTRRDTYTPASSSPLASDHIESRN